MKKFFTLAIAVVALLCTMSCVNENVSVKSQVHQVGKETSMKRFTSIKVVGSMQVIYTQGKTHSVRVESEPKAFEKMLIYVKGNELIVTSKEESQEPEIDAMMGDVKVYVTSPSLIKASVVGSGVLSSIAPANFSNFDIELTGLGTVSFKKPLTVKSLEVELTGTGTMDFASVSGKRLSTKVTGTGDVDYADVKVEHAQSNITGSGKITIQGNINEHVKKVTGAGNVVMVN